MAFVDYDGLLRFFTGIKPKLLTADQTTAISGINQIKRTNMLDNWDFRFPVNQRERENSSTLNVPSGSPAQYLLDRWKLSAGVATLIGRSGIRLSTGAVLTQYLETFYATLCGTRVTFSFHTGAVIKSATLAWPTIAQTQANVTCQNSVTIEGFGTVSVGFLYCSSGVQIGSRTFEHLPFVTYQASNETTMATVKLEAGDVSTLTYSECMDYRDAFVRCSRYYTQGRIVSKGEDQPKLKYMYWADHTFLVPMRVKPVLTFSSLELWPGWTTSGWTDPGCAIAAPENQQPCPYNDNTGIRAVTLTTATKIWYHPLIMKFTASAEF